MQSSREVFKATKVICGVQLRSDPAREPCFEIVHLHSDVPNSEGLGLEARRKRMHREFNQEVQTLEIAALCLADYPDMPWELRLELARQCWDEARHAALYQRRFEQLGVRKGDFAIANLDWSVVAMLDSLVARLAVQHRTFEAGSMDLEAAAVPMYRDAGDNITADIVEAVMADEVQHVRFANDWLNRLTESNPKAVLEIAAAITWLRKVVVATGGDPLKEVETNIESRVLSGFSQAEIAEVTRLEHIVVGQIRSAASGLRHE